MIQRARNRFGNQQGVLVFDLSENPPSPLAQTTLQSVGKPDRIKKNTVCCLLQAHYVLKNGPFCVWLSERFTLSALLEI
jgi:hypothetical protein